MSLQMWFNGTHYVVATSAQEAFDLIQDLEDSPDDFNEDDWDCLDAETPVTFCTSHDVVTRTSKEWVSLRGKGYFCSTEY